MGSMRACSPVSLSDKDVTASYELSFKIPSVTKTSRLQGSLQPSATALSPSTSGFSSPAKQDTQMARTPQQAINTSQHSAVARARHELQEERRKLQALTRVNQESLNKMTEYKERYRGLKTAMGDKGKQLDLAKRTIERLSGRCNAIEAGMATDKAYARKLEAKLSASRNISDLHARCSQYKLKLREMAQELEEAESRTASAQELADLRSTEVGTLRQALHLKASELSKQAGTDIHSRLLYAVAKSREEGVALAVQLAECKERTRQAEDAADDAHNSLQALHEQLEEAQADNQQMQQKVVDTVANCCRYEAGAQDIREEVQAMQRQVHALADEKAELVRALQAEQLQSCQHQTQATTLQQQVQNLQKQRQSEAATAIASSEHVQREMQNHCTNLQAQLDAYKEKMEREWETASSSLARERARAAAAEEATDSSKAKFETRKRQLEHDLDNAHSEVQSLTQVNQRLQDSLQATTKAHQAERAKRENLHKQLRSIFSLVAAADDVRTEALSLRHAATNVRIKEVLSLEASLSAVHSEHSQSDSSLKGRMQELLSELHSTLQERNVYKAKWQELLSQQSSSQTTVERLQRDAQQQSHAYADLQKVNQALESRLLGHRSAAPATAAVPSYSQRPAPYHSSYMRAMAEGGADSHDCQGQTWQPWASSAAPAQDRPDTQNSPSAHARAAARQHDVGCPGSPDSAHTDRSSNLHNSTTYLDSLLAEHQQRSSPARGRAVHQSTTQDNSTSAGVSRAGLSSADIMARLTRSPEHASAGYSFSSQDAPAYKHAASSGFQSPPDTDAGDATLPTEQLRTALFGAACAQQQSHGMPVTAARDFAALQHDNVQRDTVHVQQGHKTAQDSLDGFRPHGYHQQIDQASGQVHEQEAPVWHNARPWSPAFPRSRSAKAFSLHTNPLAEPAAEPSFAGETGMSTQQLSGASKGYDVQQSAAAQRQPVSESQAGSHHTGNHDLLLSLADLASIDPNTL